MRRIASTVAAILAVALMVPGIGRAELLTPECMLDGVKTAGESCSSSFEITEAEAGYKVSLIGTHGGYHGFPSAGAFGHVSIQLKDANGAVFAEYNCLSIANNADYLPLELTRASCSEVVAPPATLPVGTATVTATAVDINNAGANGSRLHGRFVLRGDLV